MEVTVLAMMTLKDMGANGKEAVKQEKQVFMARVFGEIVGKKVKERRNDDSAYSILLGQFRGIRHGADGQQLTFESEKLILPGGIQENLDAQLTSAAGASVKFGYDIFSNPDANSSTGYKYSAKVIIKTEASDRLKEMAGELESTSLPGAPKAESAAAGKKK